MDYYYSGIIIIISIYILSRQRPGVDFVLPLAQEQGEDERPLNLPKFTLLKILNLVHRLREGFRENFYYFGGGSFFPWKQWIFHRQIKVFNTNNIIFGLLPVPLLSILMHTKWSQKGSLVKAEFPLSHEICLIKKWNIS